MTNPSAGRKAQSMQEAVSVSVSIKLCFKVSPGFKLVNVFVLREPRRHKIKEDHHIFFLSDSHVYTIIYGVCVIW